MNKKPRSMMLQIADRSIAIEKQENDTKTLYTFLMEHFECSLTINHRVKLIQGEAVMMLSYVLEVNGVRMASGDARADHDALEAARILDCRIHNAQALRIDSMTERLQSVLDGKGDL